MTVRFAPLRRLLCAGALALTPLSAGCDDATPDEATPGSPVDAAAPAADSVEADAVVAEGPRAPEALASVQDVAHGKELISKYECNRCHTIADVAAPALEFDCAGCHQQILAGTFEATADDLAHYQSRLHSLDEVPSLQQTSRFRRAWVATFLPDAHDVRPNLLASMPRFDMPAADAKALAAFLVPGAEAPAPALGDADAGRALLESEGCMSCHKFSGVPSLAARPTKTPLDAAVLATGQKMAPDLRFARARLRPAALVDWIVDPKAVKDDARMPALGLSEAQAADIAAYLTQAPVEPQSFEPMAEPEAQLEREVSYTEVYDRVFGKVCRHCHSDPNQVIGDGGPGYSGGFGFRERALDLSTYEGVRSGSRDDDGKRRSVFKPIEPGGKPRIVAHLYARHSEVAGEPVEGVRGMPLGLPPLPMKDIALLETWIAQGRKKGSP